MILTRSSICRRMQAGGRLWLPILCVLALHAGGSVAAAGNAATSAGHRNHISIVVYPTSRDHGISLFKILVSGYAVQLVRGPYAHARDALFIFPGQRARCAQNVYAEQALQTAGQGFSYWVGPGTFSFSVTGFANDHWRYGHVCAYLIPLNFAVADRGGVPLGPLAARAQSTINVAHPANPGV